MNKPYFVSVVFLVSGESEKEIKRFLEPKLDKLISPINPVKSSETIVEDVWIDTIEEDEDQSRAW